MPLKATLSTHEKVAVHAVPRNVPGQPDVVKGDVIFVVTSGTCTLGDRIDAISTWVHAGEEAGESVVHVSGEVDIGGVLVTIADQIVFQVTDAMEPTFVLRAETPVWK